MDWRWNYHFPKVPTEIFYRKLGRHSTHDGFYMHLASLVHIVLFSQWLSPCLPFSTPTLRSLETTTLFNTSYKIEKCFCIRFFYVSVCPRPNSSKYSLISSNLFIHILCSIVCNESGISWTNGWSTERGNFLVIF